LPGTVYDIKVKPGEKIATGQVVLVIEAMKMENEVCAPCDGVVRAVHIVAGELVAGQKVLLRID
jgi:biotin carboxyl carrier protein